MAKDIIKNLSTMVSGSQRLHLEVEGPLKAIAERLCTIKGITRVSYDNSDFVIEYPAGQDHRSQIMATMAQGGWTPISLETVEMSLEDIFLKLTTEEETE